MWMTQEVIDVVFAFLGINSNQGAKQRMNYHLKLKVFNSKGVLAQPFYPCLAHVRHLSMTVKIDETSRSGSSG